MLTKRWPTRRAFSRRAVLLALVACLLCPAVALADDKKKDKKRKGLPTTGRIEISTNPGGHPIFIDGQPAGETTDFVRSRELPPGSHTVEILFPNGDRWSQTYNIVAGRKFCIALNYEPQTIAVEPVAGSPCPYPVNVAAPAAVNDGDIVTFAADVGYAGQSALNYAWTVSPTTARILSGQGTPTIAVDTSGLGGRRVTAALVVDDGSGERNCRQTAQGSTAVAELKTRPEASRRPDESRPETPGGGVERDGRPAGVEGVGASDGVSPATATAHAAADAQAPSHSSRAVETLNTGNATGTNCDCGEMPTLPAASSGTLPGVNIFKKIFSKKKKK